MRFYVFEDAAGRMLSPKFFYGGVTAPIDENRRMYGEKFAAGQDLPPPGTMMVSKFIRVNPNDRDVSCGAYVVAELQANPAIRPIWEILNETRRMDKDERRSPHLHRRLGCPDHYGR